MGNTHALVLRQVMRGTFKGQQCVQLSLRPPFTHARNASKVCEHSITPALETPIHGRDARRRAARRRAAAHPAARVLRGWLLRSRRQTTTLPMNHQSRQQMRGYSEDRGLPVSTMSTPSQECCCAAAAL